MQLRLLLQVTGNFIISPSSVNKSQKKNPSIEILLFHYRPVSIWHFKYDITHNSRQRNAETGHFEHDVKVMGDNFSLFFVGTWSFIELFGLRSCHFCTVLCTDSSLQNHHQIAKFELSLLLWEPMYHWMTDTVSMCSG